MTPEAIQTMRKALGLLRQPFSFILPLTLHPCAQRKGIKLSSPVPCLEPGKPMMLKSARFIGVHECLCITLVRPSTVKSLIQIAHEIPVIEPFGPVTWLTRTTYFQYPTTSKGGFIFHIPSSVFKPLGSIFHPIQTKGIIHNIWVRTHEYFILEIPIFQRKYIIPNETTYGGDNNVSIESAANHPSKLPVNPSTGNG
jgi:hypothetical protein